MSVTDRHVPHEEVEQLCSALFDGKLTTADAEKLRTLVRSDERARRTYILFMHLNSSLEWRAHEHRRGVRSIGMDLTQAAQLDSSHSVHEGVPSLIEDAENSHRRPELELTTRSWSRRVANRMSERPGLTSLIAASVVLLLGLSTMAIVPMRGYFATPAEPVQPVRVEVAKITRAIDCRWATDSEMPTEGDRLWDGQNLELVGGLLEFVTDDGVHVQLQGETSYQVGRLGEGMLFEGTLIAAVPPRAVGFTINGPGFIVIDRGTRFGVRVESSSRAHVHVFEGRVDAGFVGVAGDPQELTSLLAGDGAVFDVGQQQLSLLEGGESKFDEPALAQGGEEISRTIALVPENAAARYLVPKDGKLGSRWTQFEFDDSDWDTGTLGIGYEATPSFFDRYIQTTVRPSEVVSGANSIYVRVPFTWDSQVSSSRLTLRIRYDDGFVAYLNGTEIARRRVTGPVQYDTVAEKYDDQHATQLEVIDVTIYTDLLQSGDNVLAVQGIDSGTTSSDMLIAPSLVSDAIVREYSDEGERSNE
ncbi:MAG: hypothetical protein KDA60_18045 [Planctomycetales bacterium]|nr:hypothetical protein [Planctomycetales bacterium]